MLRTKHLLISVKNVKIRVIGDEKYIITLLNKSNSVKIIFRLKKDREDETSIPIDSTEIEINYSARLS